MKLTNEQKEMVLRMRTTPVHIRRVVGNREPYFWVINGIGGTCVNGGVVNQLLQKNILVETKFSFHRKYELTELGKTINID